MKTKRKIEVSASEQEVLDGVEVRLIWPREQKRFDELIETQHYLKDATLVGERLCYVAEYGGQWLARQHIWRDNVLGLGGWAGYRLFRRKRRNRKGNFSKPGQ